MNIKTATDGAIRQIGIVIAIVGQRCHGYVLCSRCAQTARLVFVRGVVRYRDADHDVRAGRLEVN